MELLDQDSNKYRSKNLDGHVIRKIPPVTSSTRDCLLAGAGIGVKREKV